MCNSLSERQGVDGEVFISGQGHHRTTTLQLFHDFLLLIINKMIPIFFFLIFTLSIQAMPQFSFSFDGWRAPTPTDRRSPCPALNTLANHGLMYALLLILKYFIQF
jgi:hypothetical protein